MKDNESLDKRIIKILEFCEVNDLTAYPMGQRYEDEHADMYLLKSKDGSEKYLAWFQYDNLDYIWVRKLK